MNLKVIPKEYTDDELCMKLKKWFHYPQFKEKQIDAVRCAIKKQNCLVLFPTGGGKSLCYQLPPLILNGLGIVISPLISLMQDQVNKLKSLNIKAEYLSSSQSRSEIKRILSSLTSYAANLNKKNALPLPCHLLYITPERLMQNEFQNLLSTLYDSHVLVLFAIDEAHCISTWGNDFRPSYRSIHPVLEKYSTVPIMALTASAPKKVCDDIIAQLHIEGCLCVKISINRENLFYDVRGKDSERGYSQLLPLLKQYKNESVIIYVRKKSETESLSTYLNSVQIKNTVYHAALSAEEREQHLASWLSNDTPILIGTIAVGMGIDKNNVRLVVHWNISSSIYAYYQESGRAGRDGKPSQCVIFYNEEDFNSTSFAIRNTPGKTEDDICIYKDLGELEQVYNMCTKRTCRRNSIMKTSLIVYLVKMEPSKCCDYCKNPNNIHSKAVVHSHLTVVYFPLFCKNILVIRDLQKQVNSIKTRRGGPIPLDVCGPTNSLLRVASSSEEEDKESESEDHPPEQRMCIPIIAPMGIESNEKDEQSKEQSDLESVTAIVQTAMDSVEESKYISKKQRNKCIDALVPVYSEYLSLYLPPLWVDVMAKAYAHKLEDQIYHSLAQPKELTSPINPKSNPVLLNYKSAYSERYKQLRMALYHHEPLPIPELQEFTPSYFSSSPVLMEYVHALYTPYLYPNCKTHIVKHLYSSLYSHMKEDLKTLSRKEVSTKYIDILRKQIELKQPYFSLVQSSTPE